jgi:hypothetical protein
LSGCPCMDWQKEAAAFGVGIYMKAVSGWTDRQTVQCQELK